MIRGKFNVVTDGAWGSCGKGLITSYLAGRHQPHFLTTTNTPNAGHTAVSENGIVYIAKALPSAAILRTWSVGYHPRVLVGPSAAFNLEQLFKEAQECNLTAVLDSTDLWIHPRAGVVIPEHRQREAGDGHDSTKHIASTMQGGGAFLADKVLRKPGLKLAGDYPELAPYCYGVPGESLPLYLQRQLDLGKTALHEGSQGFSLDINFGSHYPNCTSRGTTATQNLADMGLPFTHMGDVYLVIRPYPIRVGNVVENGVQKGYSGDAYEGQEEITWEQVADAAGMPPEERDALLQKELTTVTRRLRRVFTFSPQQLREAVLVNGATKIAANFVNYVDWKCRNTNNRWCLTKKVKDFITMIEDAAQIPVTLIGTGPKINHVIDLETRT